MNFMLKNHALSLPSALSQVFIPRICRLPFKIKVKLINLGHFMMTALILDKFKIINIITIISEQLNVIQSLFQDTVNFRPTLQCDSMCFRAKIKLISRNNVFCEDGYLNSQILISSKKCLKIQKISALCSNLFLTDKFGSPSLSFIQVSYNRNLFLILVELLLT